MIRLRIRQPARKAPSVNPAKMVDYSKWTVAKLKKELQDRRVPITGLKLKKHFVDKLELDDASGDAALWRVYKDRKELELMPDDDDESPSSKEPPDGSDGDLPTHADKQLSSDTTAEHIKEQDMQHTFPQTDTSVDEATAPQSFKQDSLLDVMNMPVPDSTLNDAMDLEEDRQEQATAVVASNESNADKPDIETYAQATLADETNCSFSLRKEASPGESLQRSSTPQERTLIITSSLHPATNAIYVRNLKRPIQTAAFKREITQIALGDCMDSGDDIVNRLFLDSVRTHAFISFHTAAAAIRVREALHGSPWPLTDLLKESLWVDYVPEDKLDEWISMEMNAGQASTKRWVVHYETLRNGEIHTELKKASRFDLSQPVPMPQASIIRDPAASSFDTGHVTAASHTAPETARFLALDELFRFTEAKPKIYYTPVDNSQSNRSLDQIDDARASSRARDRGDFGPPNNKICITSEDQRLVDISPEYLSRRERGMPHPRYHPYQRGGGGRWSRPRGLLGHDRR